MSDLRTGRPLVHHSAASSVIGKTEVGAAVSTISSSSAFEQIMHLDEFSANFDAICLSDDLSDVVFEVEGQHLRAHRLVLAARSDYFRAMLFGGMREQREEVISLRETPLLPFQKLLKYIYSGSLSLSGLTEEVIIKVLDLAHKYIFTQLEEAIAEYLKAALTTNNVCHIFNIAQMYSLASLAEQCCLFTDRNAEAVLLSPSFVLLSPTSLADLISRDSFCAQEINIFLAVSKWKTAHPEVSEESVRSILSGVRLPLISLEDLLNVVRPSGLLASDAILDAIKEQNQTTSANLTHRGFQELDMNVITSATAKVLTGESPNALLWSPDSSIVQDGDRVFTRHVIEDPPADNAQGITIQLSSPCIINCIVLHLWDREPRSYSYYVEVSIDRKDWVRLIDYSKYRCRSKQKLLFHPRSVKYIRVVGTYNAVNKVFHLVHIEAFCSSEEFQVDPKTGLIIPSHNMATISQKALVLEGVSRSRNALINEQTTDYDWDNGYTCHQLRSGMIIVQLCQPFLVSSMRLLLWDCDARFYSYYIEVSENMQTWKRVVDKTKEECRGWQYAEFSPLPVVFIRIVGTRNSANEVFHCVHLECPANPSSHQPLPPPEQEVIVPEDPEDIELELFPPVTEQLDD